MTDLFGAYQLRARLHPVLLAAFPAAVTAFALGAPGENFSRLAAALGAFGIVGMLAAMARDRGRRIEPDMWEAWGGPPTTTMLLSTSAEPSQSIEVHRRHARRLLPEAEVLSDRRDVTDPDGSRATVERYTTYLRERTRDRSQFPIVFDANVAYGFRRNVLGLRPIGIAISTASTLVAGGALVVVALGHLDRSVVALVLAGVTNVLIAALWAAAIPAWVKVEADRYAVALLAAAEALTPLVVRP